MTMEEEVTQEIRDLQAALKDAYRRRAGMRQGNMQWCDGCGRTLVRHRPHCEQFCSQCHKRPMVKVNIAVRPLPKVQP